MQIKFITGGANSAFGGFSAGDTLRCSEEMAKHLVEDLGCAIYMDAPGAKIAPSDPETPKRKIKASQS
jgi:hypothetical protein